VPSSSIPGKPQLPKTPRSAKRRRERTVAEIDDMKYEKQNFRQKGSQVKGLILKGAVINAYTKRSDSSIPSKFECIVYKTNLEKKGFGSKSI
jgi:hypothetical protein